MAEYTPGPWSIGKGISFAQSIYAGRVNVAFARQEHDRIDASTAEAMFSPLKIHWRAAMERGSVVNAALNEREDTTVLHDLVEKCEKLDGPCREMDKEIAVSSGEYATSRHHPGMLAHKDSPNQFGYFFPAYTASIDAAMTLVSCSRAIMNIAEGGITTAIVGGNEGCASTPALALCIASLRARSQGGE